MSSTASSSTQQHAAHRYHTGLAAAGLVFTSIGLFSLSATWATPDMNVSTSALGLSCLSFGIAFFAIGLVGRRAGSGVVAVNTSFDLISRGRLNEAEKLLDSVEAANKTPLIRSVSAVQRGLIAMRRGDPKTGLEHLDRAIGTKAWIFYRAPLRVQTINARGIRAFLRAVVGDRTGAREDIDALRQSPDVLPQALARAALAEAICIEREGDRDKLRAHLAEHRDLLLDVTDRRERAIVRAYQRMLESTATSVYRKGAKPDSNGDEPPLVDWVAQMVPAAAAFVEMNGVKEKTGDLPIPVATAGAKKEVDKARKSAVEQKKKGFPLVLKVLLLWAALIGLFVALWQGMLPSDADYSDAYDPDTLTNTFDLFVQAAVGMVFATLGWAIGRRVWLAVKARREGHELFAAMNLSARGKLDAAKERLTQLAQSRFAFVKAQACLTLAQIAEREADLQKSIEFCDRGIACLSQYVLRISASDILLPDLMSQRAFVLAATDRHDEAQAELAGLPPTYPYKSRALLRVRLVQHVRRGEMQSAATLAAEAGLDLPLNARDELLVDSIRAAHAPDTLNAGELPRIRRELRSVTPLRTWLETIAPSVLHTIEHATDEVPARHDERNRDHEAEEEARAEEEAAKALTSIAQR